MSQIILTEEEFKLLWEAILNVSGGFCYDCIDSEDVEKLKTKEEVVQFINEADDLCRGDFFLLVEHMVRLIYDAIEP